MRGGCFSFCLKMTFYMKTRTLTSFRCKLAVFFFSSIPLLHAQPPAVTGPIAAVVRQIENFVADGIQKTGVPGVAVAIVFQDKIVYLKAFGFREAGGRQPVDPDTIFQLASVSKRLASTVVASLVGTYDI